MLSDAATALLNHCFPPVDPPAQRQWHTIAEGFYLDECGVVLGRCIELDINVRGNYSPLYYYNRSWRFIGLLNVYQVPIRCQGRVLQCFEALEKVWEDTKEKYMGLLFDSKAVASGNHDSPGHPKHPVVKPPHLRLETLQGPDRYLRRPVEDFKRQ